MYEIVNPEIPGLDLEPSTEINTLESWLPISADSASVTRRAACLCTAMLERMVKSPRLFARSLVIRRTRRALIKFGLVTVVLILDHAGKSPAVCLFVCCRLMCYTCNVKLIIGCIFWKYSRRIRSTSYMILLHTDTWLRFFFEHQAVLCQTSRLFCWSSQLSRYASGTQLGYRPMSNSAIGNLEFSVHWCKDESGTMNNKENMCVAGRKHADVLNSFCIT